MSVLDQFRLDDRVAVVTGSGRGIGRGIAWALADAGAHVVLNARRIADLEATAAGVRQRGRRTLVVEGDIRDFSETLADRTVQEFGRLDVLGEQRRRQRRKKTFVSWPKPQTRFFDLRLSSISPALSKVAKLQPAA